MLDVADPERSVAFYRASLGFTVTGEHRHRDVLTWANLSREGAELMINGPISALQRKTTREILGCVMLYLYIDDVRVFRDECVARG
jgi:catechol 2,3-dioxygenase-like lactoylglutathione lyase family enzyme